MTGDKFITVGTAALGCVALGIAFWSTSKLDDFGGLLQRIHSDGVVKLDDIDERYWAAVYKVEGFQAVLSILLVAFIAILAWGLSSDY
jgi:hypothetical protein